MIELLAGEATGRRLLRPALMTLLAFGFAAALLGFAGWFLAASAVAGLAITATFSFVAPSAAVQALAWARTLSRYGERISTHRATLNLVAALRTRLFARAVQLPRNRAAELRSSELLGRITVDTDAIENLLLRSAFPTLAAIASLLGVGAAFAILSWQLALVTTVGILVTAAVLAGFAARQAGEPARALVAARATARRTLIETIDGLPELRSFGAERQARADVERQLREFAQTRRQLAKITASGHGASTLLADSTLLMVIAVAAGLIGSHDLSAPSFVAVCLLVLVAFEPVVALPAAVTARARARAASARLTELFPSRMAPKAPAMPDGWWPTTIELEERNVELTARAGDTVLVTGRSGTGKSTLLRAIIGEPVPGVRVGLAGADPATVDPELLAEHVTLVAQDAHIFDGTIRDNLQLADPAASESELWAALAAAALNDTVAAFPAGLDTPVGPGGSALSGGQRRRLSVAQGLLRHADLLLLDEPTESLDTATAAQLLDGVRSFDPTAMIVIALHDRQGSLPWAPTTRVELQGATREAAT